MKIVRKMLIGMATLVAVSSLGAWAYMMHPKFGALPAGERQERIRRSPRFVDGKFQNPIETPTIVAKEGALSVLLGFMIDRTEGLRPDHPTPARKTDLKSLDTARNVVIWLGHSSFFVQFEGKRFLIDPVLSSYASPIPFITRAFDGTNLYAVDDMPDIDVLLISHDHWDHLDYATVSQLESRTARVLAPLGIGAHLEKWGYPRAKIHEADWFESLDLGKGDAVTLIPARHYSGRLFSRNRTLWGGFVFSSPNQQMLFSGDSGYGPHFKAIGKRFGRFDLVALDMGQYDAQWPYIHMTPEVASQAAQDLQAGQLLPAHVGRFNIARHSWTEPFERISAASAGKSYRLTTPMIGEPLFLDQSSPPFAPWWRSLSAAAAPSKTPLNQN